MTLGSNPNFAHRRAIVLVLDGCGAGPTADSARFGDPDQPATIRKTWELVGGIQAPNLLACGFFAACGIGTTQGLKDRHVEFGRLNPKSEGKDSVTGHWEMMGIHTQVPFPTYPQGFPAELVAEFESRIGRKTLGNRAASGTAIITELGEEHVRTGLPILYTSADSVFQLAAHESVVPIEDLYRYCEIAREICVSPHNVQRVIARPFEGEAPFRRTERRRDFPLVAPPNLIDDIEEVYGIGVIPELFGHRGFRPITRTQSNPEHAKLLLTAMESDARFIFANFEDFDMLYGHRNDARGFAQCLVDFDVILESVLDRLTPDDLLILTSDHGNDPTSLSTDHSREFSPFCVIRDFDGLSEPVSLGDQDGLWTLGKTVAEWLGISATFPIQSKLQND